MPSATSPAVSIYNNGGPVADQIKRQTEQLKKREDQQARHKGIIRGVLEKTARLRKESKARRHRDLQGSLLDDSVDALTDFVEVVWPPRSATPSTATAEDACSLILEGLSSASNGPNSITTDMVKAFSMKCSSADSAEASSDTDAVDRSVNNNEAVEATQELQRATSESDTPPTSTPAAAAELTLLTEKVPSLDMEKQQRMAVLNGKPRASTAVLDTNVEGENADGDESSDNNNASLQEAIEKVQTLLDKKMQFQKEESMHRAVITALEAYCLVMRSLSKTPKMCEIALECVCILVNNGYVSGEAGTKDKDRNPASASANGRGKPEEAPLTLLDYAVESTAKCSESSSDLVHIAMSRALLSMVTCKKCGIHEAALLVSVRSTFHVYLVSKTTDAKDVSRATLLDMLKAAFSRMEAYDAIGRSNLKRVLDEAIKKINHGADESVPTPCYNLQNCFSSQYHTDAYLLFRALCKLSAKTLPDEDQKSGLMAAANSKFASSLPFGAGVAPGAVDPLALHSKILSLELILAVFEHCGDAFRNGDKFIYAVQNYLCVSLLKNCMSVHTDVAYMSLKIFLVLVYNFRAHLKSEIEVFMANIFLRVLESPNSSFDQKALVLEALRILCSDPSMLTQLFLNYDCDFDAVDLYKSIVRNLTRVSSKPRLHSSYPNASQESALCQAGLEVLIVILQAFLKVLNLPGGDDEIDDSMSTLRSKSLHLDIASAINSDRGSKRIKAERSTPEDTASDSGDSEIYVRDVMLHNYNDGAADDGSEGGSSASPHPSGNGSHNEDFACKIVDAFDRKRTVQQNFETGIIKFTMSLKGGLLYFIENGFVTLDARDVSGFFYKHQDRLDKTQIGEGLGKEPESAFVKDKGVEAEKGGEGFFVRILHHYVHQLEFTGMEFDEAIRFFLSGFRLPGEAQKIDRIMEKFAERFTRENEEVFPSADTAFILAFSVIMLNTDLHNPSIKPEKRMTVESFIRNNRGISVDGGDLPEDFLRGIFYRIEAQPFSLKEDDEARDKEKKASMRDTFFALQQRNFFGVSAEERKRETFRKEREEMMSASEQLFKKRPSKARKPALTPDKVQHSHLAQSVLPSDVVKPMFDVTWGPLIGTLSQILETTDEQGIINLCLNGFVYSVRISAHSDMSLARDTFINALTKFTTLGSIKEMKFKNIESIQTLLSIAIMDGEHLGESWGPVLQCISHLARLQTFATGGADDDRLFRGSSSSNSNNGTPLRANALVREDSNKGFLRSQSKVEIEQATEAHNAHAVLAAVNEILIDKVFSSTVNLSATSMAHFVEQLIRVSAAEISGDLRKSGIGVQGSGSSKPEGNVIPSSSAHWGVRGKGGPRTFSLQKLVEVADYNMDARPRIAWTQMWEEMAKHFALIGCNENAMVSMFAIDALRQLSFKFLQKPELYDFNFQRVFLRPFLSIMENPGSRQDIRELVLRCVDNMIRTLSHNLRSGWKIFFQIITLSADDPSEKISTLGLAILQRLLDEHLEELCLRHVIEDDNESSNLDGSHRILGDGAATEHAAQGGIMLQRKVRNANAEDFVDLCLASLAFVQTDEGSRPLPVGLSMRALCHTACYADLIASGRIIRPCTCHSSDPHTFGYTYEGLDGADAEEMVLWKPILDGLAAGIRSKAKSNSGGVGCLVQRGSVMTLRSILLRHGSLFSSAQWSVILKQVVLPSMQSAAESDPSPVTMITSETPSVSNLDFVAEPLPMPPSPDEDVLRSFAKKAQSDESAPKRPLGHAELLVEASFADLRHGGDGDLGRLYGGRKRSWQRKTSDQPFPDSWVATTSAIALGILTDVMVQFAVDLGEEGRTVLWPLVLGHLSLWTLGPPLDFSEDGAKDSDVISVLEDEYYDAMWRPSEALIRVGCKELNRIPEMLKAKFETISLDCDKQNAWWRTISKDLSGTIRQNVVLLEAIREELIELKMAAISPQDSAAAQQQQPKLITEPIVTGANTPYGKGTLIGRRKDQHSGFKTVLIWKVSLQWGGTLYGPEPEGLDHDDENENDQELQTLTDQDSLENADSEAGPNIKADITHDDEVAMIATLPEIFERFVPAFKVRCVAACLLQQSLRQNLPLLLNHLAEDDFKTILDALDASRDFASRAIDDEDMRHAFKELYQMEIGGTVEEVEAAIAANSDAGKGITGGSESFFVMQEAGANRVMVHLLSTLYCFGIDADAKSSLSLSRSDIISKYESFAEPLLLERMGDVLAKFLDSDQKEGIVLDPSIWRKPSEHYGSIPLYCTAFCGVIVGFLEITKNMTTEQFMRNKDFLYPILCSLVQVQSNEVRRLVSEILVSQVTPLLLTKPSKSNK